MLPITTEPNGQNENQNRNDSRSIHNENEDLNPVDQTQNNIAGNAAGNVDPENSDEEVTPEIKGKGFMGDFEEPQHDE